MASTGDKITDTRNAARPVSTTVSSPRSAGGATLVCASLSGWPTASKVHFVTYQIDSLSNPIAGTQLDCYGIVSGSNIGSFTVVDGNDTGNSVGDIVEMLPTAAWGQDLADALMAEHERDGTHGDITPTSVTTPTLTVSSGSVLPAGDIGNTDLATDSVSTIKIQNDAVTDGKLIYGKLRSRQGGSATNWQTVGTTTYDYSATNTFMQAGSINSGGGVTVTFPTAFNQIPIVIASVNSAVTQNVFVRVTAQSATQCVITCITDAGGLATGEVVNWIAIGE